MKPVNPHDIPAFLAQTSPDALDADPVYRLALHLAEAVQALHTACTERPRYSDLWNQAARASSSVVLNYSQAHGKGKGHYQQDLMIARGELYELWPCVHLLPGGAELKDAVRRLAKDLDGKILATPDKPAR